MSKPQSLEAALEHLVKAARNGRRAKARLATALAKLPPEQLRKISPKYFAALGPNGMKLFAGARDSTDSGLLPATKPAVKVKKPPFVRRLLALPWVKGVSVALLCILAGVVIEQTGSYAIDAGILEPARTYQGWPVCRRLDLAGNGCVYWTSSDRFTIEQIVAVTGLVPGTLIEANPHIDFHNQLPKGTMLVVPGKLYF
ncbi:MAG: hypothetical protein ABS76_19705 [Pelagibacterium sp. SCN 64-44]|nr:MAG: hypothetical protein ABS76_19705 [Pelagibacterium sp. SCN 64-44]